MATGTAAQLAEVWKRRQSLVEREFRQSSRALGISARAYSRQLMTEQIYALPEDRTKAGKKKWRRTGKLRRGETYRVEGLGTVIIENNVPYAEPRHEAGKPGRRPINPARESHWREELLEVFRPIVLDVRRSTIQDILRADGSRTSTRGRG